MIKNETHNNSINVPRDKLNKRGQIPLWSIKLCFIS